MMIRPSAALRHHRPAEGLAAVEDAGEIDRQRFGPRFFGHVQNPVLTEDPRVRDQDVNPIEGRACSRERRLDRAAVSYVQCGISHSRAVRRELLGDRGGGAFVDIAHDDVRALLNEPLGDGPTDAVRPTRYYAGLALEQPS